MFMKTNKKFYPYISFLFSLLIIFLVYAFVGIFPFGDKTVITGDLNGQYMSYFSHFAQSLKQFNLNGFFYGFDKSLGGTLIGSFAYYCASPLNLLYLLFTPGKYPLVATIILALKLSLCSATMCYLITKRFSDIDFMAIPVSLCYGFCAYNLVYAQNIMWLDTVLMLPLVIWGIYNLLQNNKPLFYIITLFVTVFSDFYTAYMVCIFCVIYFLYELFANYPVTDWFKKGINFAVSSLCGGGLAASLLIPMYLDIKANKGLSPRINYTGEVGFKITEFFYRLFPFNFDWSNLENGLPNVYTGTLCIVLFTLFIVCKNISKKDKLATITVLIIIFLSMYSYDFMLIWHGFAKPVWFPFRNSFIFSFWFCYLSAYGYTKGNIDIKRIILAVFIIFALIAQAFLIRNIWFTLTFLCIGIIFIAANSLSLIGIKLNIIKNKKVILGFVTVLCVCELTANSHHNIKQFENYSYTSISNFYNETSSALQTVSKENIYSHRVEKTFWRSFTDPMYLNYPGISYFGSTQDNSSVGLIYNLGYLSSNVYEADATAFAESFLGIGNIISKEETELPSYIDDYYKVDNILVGTNKYTFPLGFLLNKNSADFNFDSNKNIFENQNSLYNALGGEGALFVKCDSVEFDKYHFSVNVKEDGILYAILSSENNEPVILSWDNNKVNYFGSKNPGTVDLGEYTAGESLTVEFTAEWGVHSINGVEVWTMDKSKLAALSELLNISSGNSSISSTQFTSIINSNEDGIYVLNIPYSEFLSVEIDGEDVLPFSVLDGLAAINISAGKHSIVASASAPGLKTGSLISLIFIVITIFWTKYNQGLLFKATHLNSKSFLSSQTNTEIV